MNKILFAITFSSCFLFVKSIVWNATTSYSFLFCAAMPWQPPRDWLQAYHKSPGLCFRKDSDWCYSHFFFLFFTKKKSPVSEMLYFVEDASSLPVNSAMWQQLFQLKWDKAKYEEHQKSNCLIKSMFFISSLKIMLTQKDYSISLFILNALWKLLMSNKVQETFWEYPENICVAFVPI